MPLALLLGEVTEDLAARFGTAIGALLNVSFGNSVELILSVAALQKGLYDVVAASLVGSVLSNLLLVLGASPTASSSCFSESDMPINREYCAGPLRIAPPVPDTWTWGWRLDDHATVCIAPGWIALWQLNLVICAETC